ncbi:site-specific recombinase, DNA invertase Pin [Frankia sp. CcI6]|nr:site-specific recombinase, DNA invertase Pin [Frankia sp. CcI6]KDA40480.1 site-specific recombinase, DNA invertase Pin [Frankia sp. BMG5.23]KFB02502.1 site-specific recombinase, DNA invertase Pin [Frankia sp. Allo2]OHV47167.1 hypothetical protein CgIS1_22310 [Frankia sp. CgIS1]ORT46733.1 hypothetical protein KBI5_23620 [Frankia sp. KB5]
MVYRVVRPVYEGALEDLKRGATKTGKPLDGLIVSDVDRLTRDPRHLEDAIDVVVQYGRPVIDISGTLDLLTDNGRSVARIVVALKNQQSADTSRRVRTAHRELAKAGVPVGGYRPFGWEPDKRTIRKAEADMIVVGADEILAGVGTHTLCRRWNELGILTTRGHQWQRQVMKNMYLSPRLAGYRVHGPTTVPLEQRYACTVDGQPVMGLQGHILDVEVWEKVVAKLRDPARTGNQNIHIGGRKYLLSGIIRCAYCGARLTGGWDKGWKKHHYSCRPVTAGGCGSVAVTGHHVDELVTNLVLAYLANRDVEAESGPWPKPAEAEIAEIMAAWRETKRGGTRALQLVEELEGDVAKLRGERNDWLRAHSGPQLTNVASSWPRLEVEQRRDIIATVIEAVVLSKADGPKNRFDPDRITVIWRP